MPTVSPLQRLVIALALTGLMSILFVAGESRSATADPPTRDYVGMVNPWV